MGQGWHARRARRAQARLRGGVVLACLLLAGCTTPAGRPADVGDGQVEVFTWWASGSEKDGLDALVSVFAEQNPQTRFVDGAIAGGAGSAAKDLLGSRLANGDPPDTFQVHGGAELREHVAAGHLQDLDDLYAELDLAAAIPPSVLELLTVDGSVYAVPSNVHRANVLWSNSAVLQEAGLDPAASYPTLDDWFAALEAVEETGRTPLAIASTWTQVHLLEQVLLSRLGPVGYSGLWDGTTDPGSHEVAGAVADFGRLLGFTNPDRDSLDWQDATHRVVGGEAAFTVMGDWALVPIEAAGTADQIAWAPVPGTAGTFDLIVDAFTLPVDAPHPQSARRWLASVSSPDAQVALSAAKGSIPARSDVDQGGLGEYQAAALDSFATDTLVASLTHGTAGGAGTLDAVSTAVGRFSSGASDLTQLQAEVAAALA